MSENDQISDLLEGLAPEVQQIVVETLKTENGYLHMSLPRGIHDDLLEMIKRVVS